MVKKSGVTPTWTINPLPKSPQLYINSVGISANGQRAICGNYYFDYSKTANHTTAAPAFSVGVFLYNAQGKLLWQDVFQATEGVYWVTVSGDGSWAASGGLISHGHGFISAYDGASGHKALNCTTNARVNRVAISSDGTYLVAGSDSTYFFERSGSNWSTPKTIPCATGDHVVSVDISDDGQWIAVGTANGVVSLVRNTNGVLSAPVSWQQPQGSIYWIEMAADGSGFVAGARDASVMFFSSAGFHQGSGPTWTEKLAGCTRCGSVGISGDGALVSAVGNSGKTGKVFLFQNQNGAAKSLWTSATLHNPNSTSLDSAGSFVTVADGQPDGTPGAFYLFDAAGNLKWRFATSNMSWPMQISEDAGGIACGSDDSNLYYFGLSPTADTPLKGARRR